MALEHCRREGLDPAELHWLEPSAGAGVFLDTAPAGVGRMSAVDIVPMAAGIRRADFLRTRRADYPAGARLAVIGNPPFGYQATMARLFIEHALLALCATFVCFVVPGVATGAYLHNQFAPGVGMAAAAATERDAFVLPDGAGFHLGAPPQIAVYALGAPRKALPPRTHPDFRTNGIQLGLAEDRRRKIPRPLREHGLRRIREGGFCCAQRPISGKVLLPGEIPDEWDALDGFGDIILVYPRRIGGAELVRRLRSIDWRGVAARIRAEGNAHGGASRRSTLWPRIRRSLAAMRRGGRGRLGGDDDRGAGVAGGGGRWWRGWAAMRNTAR